MNTKYQLTDYNKQAIQRCYNVMSDYISLTPDGVIENMNDYGNAHKLHREMCRKIDKEYVSLPVELFVKIKDYAMEKLYPAPYIEDVDDDDEYLQDCRTREDRLGDLEAFADDNLHPITLGTAHMGSAGERKARIVVDVNK